MTTGEFADIVFAMREANVTQKVTKLLKNVKKSPLKREF